MFDQYDNNDKKYEVMYPDNIIVKLTTQELYELFLFIMQDFQGDFTDLKLKLDMGDEVNVSHNEWDFGLGTPIFKGFLKVKRINSLKAKNPKNDLQKTCNHKDKYIVQHFNGGAKYWVCPVCKADLGDA